VRLFAAGVLTSLCFLEGAPRCAAADAWGGSLAVTSDYVVRGISRSDDRAALQLDLHYLNASGFVAGLFASNAQIDGNESRDVEIDAFAGFAWTAGNDWLGVSVVYSPDSPLFLPLRGLIGVASESAEVNLQRPLARKLSATAGIGYSHFEGAYPEGYAYWSVGAAYDLAPVSLVVSYVSATAGARTLFYNAAQGGRVTGTLIWRF
jgi:hypothetical protein